MTFDSPLDDGPTADIDRPSEDTVFLAPRRDFTPGGSPQAEGQDADIESPYARFTRKTVSGAMAPRRRSTGVGEAPPIAFSRLSPASGADLDTPSDDDVTLPRSFSEPPAPDVAKLPPRPALNEPSLPTPPPAPADPVPPSLTSPSLIRPRPVRPFLISPPSPENEVPAVDDAVLFDEAFDAPLTSSADEAAAADEILADEAPPFPVPEPAFDMRPLRRRPISSGDANAKPTETPPAKPGVLSRLSPGAAVNGLGRGVRAAWRGLKPLTAAAIGGCRTGGARLHAMAGTLLTHGRSLLARIGHMLGRLARSGVHQLTLAFDRLRTVVKAAAPHIAAFARCALATARYASVGMLSRLRQFGVLAFQKARGLADMTASLTAKAGHRLSENASSLAASTATSFTSAKARLAPSQERRSPAPAASSQAVAIAKLSPIAKFGGQVMPRLSGVKQRIASLAGRDPLAGIKVPRLASAGFAASLLVLLVAAFGPNQGATPANAALTGVLPDRPATTAAAASEPVDIAALDPKRELAGIVAALPPRSAATAAGVNDPIAAMIAHVNARSSVPSDVSPLLQRLASVEGLSQFAQAADLVGLGELLDAGQAYTMFVPNDAAFAKLAPGAIEGLLEPAGHERLLPLLSHHIVAERLTFEDIAGGVQAYTSLAGQPLTIDATEVIRVGEAGMVASDLEAENGVLHVIDGIITVPSL